ncbi:MAG: xylose isomerase [Gammaproteobacteria bacterium CG_4_10_14_0_8_um_filter_38_16]|nr:MAG: xylose isomerase [Gammaproteobacteria bacterium CG_4_10_14_0_8_um_filter_38_16]PJA04445.1 MAG: xylose isomerase [Gammaproteobacteria bacterium CG_4_10_14_0_2_um_filter_38_22]PJB11010.1 MAG: xylose isomerase [Gammaproteobacteria bacterium CG_4_9_14_3_um_filter_38_9]
MFFDNVEKIQFENRQSQNPLSYRYYDADKKIWGKTMSQHLRIAICFWHTFCWQGQDIFGEGTFNRDWLRAENPLKRAENRALAAFEFFQKLGVPFYTFHDRDVSPEGDNLKETQYNLLHMQDFLAQQMDKTGVKLLWGTANLFSHPRYAAGAATNPNPAVFAFAASQVKYAMDMTKSLNGENYVLWGGREGYDTLLNTDLKKELDQYARFLHLVAEYKHKIGFKGALLIEPKPCEPTKHQYDFDTATVYAFLSKYGLEKEFKVNIEGNHATLAGHSFEHEVATAFAYDLFGSIDANQGDPQLGWDTDQFPTDHRTNTAVLYQILSHGGFTTGGFNFDTKLRRQSLDLDDLFYGTISGIDALAKSLEAAAKLITDKKIDAMKQARYHDWESELGKMILSQKTDLAILEKYVNEKSLAPKPVSGKQELLEILMDA